MTVRRCINDKREQEMYNDKCPSSTFVVHLSESDRCTTNVDEVVVVVALRNVQFNAGREPAYTMVTG